jgi:hypothetical protein
LEGDPFELSENIQKWHLENIKELNRYKYKIGVKVKAVSKVSQQSAE